MKAAADFTSAYYVFDLPFYDGERLTGRPLVERKERREQVLRPVLVAGIRFTG